MAGMFAENPYYVEYESLLKRLHELNATGAGDSEGADLLRDEMDRPFSQLSDEEVERLRGLSADLHMLEGNELFEPLQPGEDSVSRTPDRLLSRLREASTRGDVETALAVMRKGQLPLPHDQIASLRASGYETLGHWDTALLFMRHAARLAPQAEIYKMMLLQFLCRWGREKDAILQAGEYLRDDNSPPGLLIHAAAVISEAASAPAVVSSDSIWEETIQCLLRVLGNSEATVALPPSRAILGYLALGSCYRRLGRDQDALTAINAALELDPQHDAALAARGSLQAATNPACARADFQQAISHNTALFTPYFYLAHQSLFRGEYEGCLTLCDKVMARTTDSRIRAIVMQWTAIALYELHESTALVREAFETAVALDPLNERIRENFATFQRITQIDSAVPPHPIVWETRERLDTEEMRLISPGLPVAA